MNRSIQGYFSLFQNTELTSNFILSIVYLPFITLNKFQKDSAHKSAEPFINFAVFPVPLFGHSASVPLTSCGHTSSFILLIYWFQFICFLFSILFYNVVTFFASKIHFILRVSDSFFARLSFTYPIFSNIKSTKV